MQVTHPYGRDSGQAFLLVILVMVVALTVGITLASRTLVNQRASIEEDESQKAFSAAEAAIESAINNKGNIASQNFGTNSTYEASFVTLKSSEFLFNGGNNLQTNEGYDLWLSDYEPVIYAHQWNGSIKVYWGTQASACNNAALELIVYQGAYSGPTSIPTTTRYAYDPCAARRSSNNFNSPTVSNNPIGDKTFPYNVTIGPITNGLFMRIIPIYNTTPLGVQGSNGVSTIDLPAQGTKVEASGTVGQTERKISVYQGYPALSEVFQYGIFVPTSQ